MEEEGSREGEEDCFHQPGSFGQSFSFSSPQKFFSCTSTDLSSVLLRKTTPQNGDGWKDHPSADQGDASSDREPGVLFSPEINPDIQDLRLSSVATSSSSLPLRGKSQETEKEGRTTTSRYDGAGSSRGISMTDDNGLRSETKNTTRASSHFSRKDEDHHGSIQSGVRPSVPLQDEDADSKADEISDTGSLVSWEMVGPGSNLPTNTVFSASPNLRPSPWLHPSFALRMSMPVQGMLPLEDISSYRLTSRPEKKEEKKNNSFSSSSSSCSFDNSDSNTPPSSPSIGNTKQPSSFDQPSGYDCTIAEIENSPSHRYLDGEEHRYHHHNRYRSPRQYPDAEEAAAAAAAAAAALQDIPQFRVELLEEEGQEEGRGAKDERTRREEKERGLQNNVRAESLSVVRKGESDGRGSSAFPLDASGFSISSLSVSSSSSSCLSSSLLSSTAAACPSSSLSPTYQSLHRRARERETREQPEFPVEDHERERLMPLDREEQEEDESTAELVLALASSSSEDEEEPERHSQNLHSTLWISRPKEAGTMKVRERDVPSHAPRALISGGGPPEGRDDQSDKVRSSTPRGETEGEHRMETSSFSSSSSNTSHSIEAFPHTGCETSSAFRPTTSISGSLPSSASSPLPASEFSSPLVTPVPPSIPPLLSLPGFAGPAGFAASLLPPPHSQAVPLSSSVRLSSSCSSSAASSETTHECLRLSSPCSALRPPTEEIQKSPQNPTKTNSSFSSFILDDPAVSTLQKLLTSSSSCSSGDQTVPPLPSLPLNATTQVGQAAGAVSSSSGEEGGTPEENREVSSFRKRSDPSFLIPSPSSLAHQQGPREDRPPSQVLDQPTASYQVHPYLISSSSSLVVSSSTSAASSSVSYSEHHHHVAQVVCLSEKEKRDMENNEKNVREFVSLTPSLLAASSSPNLLPSTPSISSLLSDREEKDRQDKQQRKAPSPSQGGVRDSQTGTPVDTQTPLVNLLSTARIEHRQGGDANMARLHQGESRSHSSLLENGVSAFPFALSSSSSSSFCLARITTANGTTSFLSPRGFEEHQKKLLHQRPIDMDVTSISSMPSEMHARGTTGDEEREKTRSHSLSQHQEGRTIEEEGGERAEKEVSSRNEHGETFTSTTSLHPPVPSVPVGRILSREEVRRQGAHAFFSHVMYVDMNVCTYVYEVYSL